MTLERRIAQRNADRRTVKTGTVAVAVGATAATGILTAALAHPAGEPITDPARVSVTVTPATVDATVNTKKPKPPKTAPVTVKPTPAPKPKPANTNAS